MPPSSASRVAQQSTRLEATSSHHDPPHAFIVDVSKGRLDEIRRQLAIPVPVNTFRPYPGARIERDESRVHVYDFDGQRGATPLSITCLDPELDVPATINTSVQGLLDRLEATHSTVGPLTTRQYEALYVGMTYSTPRALGTDLFCAIGLATTGALEALRPGEKWRAQHDIDAGLDTVQADLVCFPDGKEWLGAFTVQLALPDEEFEGLHAYACSMGAFPPLGSYIERGRTRIVHWAETEGEWLPLPPPLRSMVQLSALLSSKYIRSQAESTIDPAHPFDPKITLLVTTGSRIFLLTGLVEYHDTLPYSRLAISPLHNQHNLPLRSILAGLALYHLDTNALPIPPSLDPALVCASTVGLERVTMPVAAEKELRDLQGHCDGAAEPSETNGRGGEDVGREVDSSRPLPKGGRTGGAGSVAVIRLPDGHATRPKRFRLVSPLSSSNSSSSDASFDRRSDLFASRLTPAYMENPSSSSRSTDSSPPADADAPYIVLETLLSHSYPRVYGSTATGLAIKLLYRGDEEEHELWNEAKVYEAIYASVPDASSFLMEYHGLFEAPSGELALVMGAGESVDNWDEPSAEIIRLVSLLHAAGYTHGGLACRNLVRTSQGVRLIDLGRSSRATCEEKEWEMSELKAVLAGRGGSGISTTKLLTIS